MTDNEIKKALECCINDDCDNCPDTFGNCEHNAMRKALDLINRQQAEIERLDAIGTRLSDICTEQDVEIEGLKKETNKQQLMNEMRRLTVEEIKTEAIKEFADRLKAYFEDEFIDNLVKEMTEADNNE